MDNHGSRTSDDTPLCPLSCVLWSLFSSLWFLPFCFFLSHHYSFPPSLPPSFRTQMTQSAGSSSTSRSQWKIGWDGKKNGVVGMDGWMGSAISSAAGVLRACVCACLLACLRAQGMVCVCRQTAKSDDDDEGWLDAQDGLDRGS
ncbi:hypothetical protein IWZ03DRAFT_2146 [Phyllosticta citriasiana]|uniref:Uncharacterized protein n=1 Tax=Phyllosticta citriasiana TaxID=595635 RepID=A0ABR1KX29_9PEZI